MKTLLNVTSEECDNIVKREILQFSKSPDGNGYRAHRGLRRNCPTGRAIKSSKRILRQKREKLSSILQVQQMGTDIEPTEDLDESALLEEQFNVLREVYDNITREILQFLKSNIKICVLFLILESKVRQRIQRP